MNLQQNPLLCENNMVINSDTPQGKIEQKVLQYMQEAGDQLVVYSSVNNHWTKQSLPKSSYNPSAELESCH